MTPPAHLSSRTLQEADDNHSSDFHFGVIRGCHKTRSPNPLLYLIYACNNWIPKPSTTSAYLPSHHMCPTLQAGEDCKMDALDEEALRRKVTSVVEAQQQLQKVVEEQMKKNHERQRQAASRSQLPNFAVGDM